MLTKGTDYKTNFVTVAWKNVAGDANVTTATYIKGSKFEEKSGVKAGTYTEKLVTLTHDGTWSAAPEYVTEKITEWALEFDPEFGAYLAQDKVFAEKIFAIGRGGKKPRKDLATWADAKPYMGFFYDEFFTVEDRYPENFNKADIIATLEKFTETYDYADDMNTWFDKVKAIADALGFASDMKAYKADPTAFKGSVADVSMFIRVAVTGKQNAPDLYTVMQIIGKEKTLARINKMIDSLK
jgi:glutamyl-tRNA synthetase